MRRLMGAVGVLLMVMSAPGLAAAEPAAEADLPLAFVDSDPLEISCSELAEEKGVRVPVRNETAVRQEVALGLALEDENGRTVASGSVCGELRVELEKTTLAAGETTRILLTADEETDARKITGSLVVHGDKGRVARKEATIAAQAPAHDLEATPLDSSVSATFEDLDAGTIWVPIKGEPPDDEEGTKPVTVGALSGPGDPVEVVYKGRAEALKGEASKVALELEGDLEPGTYSGTVDLDPGEKGEVELEVEVSEQAYKAAAAIFAGILVGLGLLTFASRFLPRTRLKGRLASLRRRYEEAVKSLEESEGGELGWKSFRIKDLSKRRQVLEAQIDEALAKTFVKIEKSVRENIEKGTDLLEAQVDLLKALPAPARDLELALQLPRPVGLQGAEGSGGKTQSELEIRARKAIQGSEISAAELESLIGELGPLAEQVRRLRSTEAVLGGLWRRLPAVTVKADRLRCEDLLSPCERHLLAVEDAKGLEAVGHEIQKAEDEIEAAISKLGVRKLASWAGSEGEMPPEEMAQAIGEAIGLKPREHGAALAMVATAQAAPPLAPPQFMPFESRLEAEKATEALRRGQWAQLLVALVTGVIVLVVGLEALYVGETWGTTWDYIAAISWGIAAEASLASLATSLDDLRALRWLRRGA